MVIVASIDWTPTTCLQTTQGLSCRSKSNDATPKELEKHFQSEETLCVLTFLHHVSLEIQRTNLELQKESITAIELYRIITPLQYKLKQRLDTSFFGIQCRKI